MEYEIRNICKKKKTDSKCISLFMLITLYDLIIGVLMVGTDCATKTQILIALLRAKSCSWLHDLDLNLDLSRTKGEENEDEMPFRLNSASIAHEFNSGWFADDGLRIEHSLRDLLSKLY